MLMSKVLLCDWFVVNFTIKKVKFFLALKFPQIINGLKDVEAELGGKGVFELEVSGKPKVVKW